MARNNGDGSMVGWISFASVMMILVGFFQAFVGLTAIFKDTFFVLTQNNLFSININAWGWIHLLLSLMVIAAGYGIMNGSVWARSVGVILAMLSAVANLAFIPYYPIWSILVIVVDVVVIFALIVHGGELKA